MSITKADIVDEVAQSTGLTKVDVKYVVDGVLNAIINSIAKGERIELRGFGVFKTKHRKSRAARNPRTGQIVELKDRYVPVFKTSPDFFARVNDAMTGQSKKKTK